MCFITCLSQSSVGYTPGNVPSLIAKQTLELLLSLSKGFLLPSVGSGFHDGTILRLCSALGAFAYDEFTVDLSVQFWLSSSVKL